MQKISSCAPNWKIAVSVFVRTILAAVLGLLLYLTIMMVATVASTSPKTRVYEKDENGSLSIVTEYYNNSSESSAESLESQEEIEQPLGETTTTATTANPNLIKQPCRSPMPSSVENSALILAQVLFLILLISMAYSRMWYQGDRDSNSVQFGHIKKDMLRGLKVGLLAGIPSFSFFVILLVGKVFRVLPDYFALYRYLNLSVLPVSDWFVNIGNAVETQNVGWPLFVLYFLSLAIIPLSCYVAYILGYRHFSISEKVVYVNPNKKKNRRR